MNSNSKNATDFHKHLAAKLRMISNKTGENINRLRRKVAFDRLLARVSTREPPSFFLKGGYAMELCFPHARTTKDMDLTCLIRSSNMEPLSQLILQELQTYARIDLNDYFTYQIGQPQLDIENAPYGGSRYKVLAHIHNTFFAEFDLDAGGDFLVDHIEKIRGENWLEFCGINAPIIPMITIEQQFAEKLHSYTLPREQINTRSKDLIDLILLLKPQNRAPACFLSVLQRVFKARNTHPLPTILQPPPISWQKPFTAMATECSISQNLNEAFKIVSEFYNNLLEMSKNPVYGH